MVQLFSRRWRSFSKYKDEITTCEAHIAQQDAEAGAKSQN